MNIEEKKQIYLDRFPAIIGKRMADQCDNDSVNKTAQLDELIYNFGSWESTNEKGLFWKDIHYIYTTSSIINHRQILDIFHFYNINP